MNASSTTRNDLGGVERETVVGTMIAGKYVLERLLGEGGMGSVWLARNTVLGTTVALKLVRKDVEAPDAADRLLTEARAGARVNHPAIVRVFDFGTTDLGEPFIVMEVLEGQTLDDVIEEHFRISPLFAAQILLPVIDGLACIHEHGIVHRDLKPSNIFLDRKSKRIQPKVLDFGIAKFHDSDLLRKLTRQGAILGSPSYMSPEQARGLTDIDARSDLFTLAVVLYECITNDIAFSGDSYNAVLRSVIEEPVIPIAKHGIDDPWLSEIVEKGLKKDRTLRFESARAFGVALAEWAVARGVTEDVTGSPIAPYWLSGREVPNRPRAESARPAARRTKPTREAEAPVVFVGGSRSHRASPMGHAQRFGRGARWVVAGFAGILAFVGSYTAERTHLGTHDASSTVSASQPVVAPTVAEHPQTLAVPPAAPIAAPSAAPMPSVAAPVLAPPVVEAPVAAPKPIPTTLPTTRAPARPMPVARRKPVRAPEPTRVVPTEVELQSPPSPATKTEDAPLDLKDPY